MIPRPLWSGVRSHRQWRVIQHGANPEIRLNWSFLSALLHLKGLTVTQFGQQVVTE